MPTDFDGFTDVTSLLTTDGFLASRSGSGINFPLSTLAAAVMALAGNGSASAPGISFAGDPDTGIFWVSSNVFAITNGGTERARFDANGRMGIGVTSTPYKLNVVDPNIAASGIIAAFGDGNIAGGLQVVAASSGLQFGLNALNSRDLIFQTNQTTRMRIQSTGHILAGADNSYFMGTASFRWSAVYAATGTIQTSDEREKTWRGAISEAEARAALRIISELGFYQWNDAIESKGTDAARLHFGARAQRVWAIMAGEGLVDPIGKDGRPGETPYAFLCFDEWEAEYEDEYETVTRTERVPVEDISPLVAGINGKPARKLSYRTVERQVEVPTGKKLLVRAAGNRFGIRPDQLTLFLLAAQAQRQSAIEARLAAIEAA